MLHFEDEIFEFVKCVATLQNSHVIFIIKIPILENQEYDLIQLETTNINGSRINLETHYVAKFKQTIYKQHTKCILCDNSHKLNDDCVYNILTNQAAACTMSKDTNQVTVKEIIPGTILLDSKRGVHVSDSCGDDRIIATPTIIETENCTVKILNQTFSHYLQTISSPEFSTPIFGKQIASNHQPPNIEEIQQVNLENLEELRSIRLQLFKSHTIGGTVIASITIALLILVYLHRYRKHHSKSPIPETDNSKTEVPSQGTLTSEDTPTSARSKFSTKERIITLPKLQILGIREKSNEDVRHLKGDAL